MVVLPWMTYLWQRKFIHPYALSMAGILAIYLENYERYSLGLYCGHIGNHIWAFILCCDLWPWMTLKGQNSKIRHFAVCIFKKSSFKSSVIIKTIDSHLKLWFTNMTSDLERSYNMFSTNILKTVRDTVLVCIKDI